MTSSTLISNRLSTSAAVCELPVSDTGALSDRSTSSQTHLRKLPYQEDLQLKLLNLQAETEALLEQLQQLKLQKGFDQETAPSEPVS